MKKLRTGKDADESSLSHTKWNCMYHIVFIPKYRRKSIMESCVEILGHTYEDYVIIKKWKL